MDINWDESHHRVQARAQQVTHLVNKKYSHRDRWIEGEPEVVDLPFKCVEGDLNVTWGYWPNKMKKIARHQQFLPSMTIKVVSVENYATQLEEEVFAVYSDDDNDDNDDENEEEGNGGDDDMGL